MALWWGVFCYFALFFSIKSAVKTAIRGNLRKFVKNSSEVYIFAGGVVI